ncbi:MAG: ACP phosphodiesterase [Flammeovirgaceae bacterium]
MNFLAHIYLSGESEELLIGNFIADFIKGNRYDHYSDEIIRGIQLHRAIDQFTDQHVMVKKGTKRLRPLYGKYSSVIIDVFYDHFLAKNWALYHDNSLQDHAQHVYSIFNKYMHQLPARVQSFIPSMIQHNWLVNYGKFYGIERSLESIAKRARFKNNMANAIEALKKDYKHLDKEFNLFFPYVIEYSKRFIADELDDE